MFASLLIFFLAMPLLGVSPPLESVMRFTKLTRHQTFLQSTLSFLNPNGLHQPFGFHGEKIKKIYR